MKFEYVVKLPCCTFWSVARLNRTWCLSTLFLLTAGTFSPLMTTITTCRLRSVSRCVCVCGGGGGVVCVCVSVSGCVAVNVCVGEGGGGVVFVGRGGVRGGNNMCGCECVCGGGGRRCGLCWEGWG